MIKNDTAWKDQFVTACDIGDWIEIERLVDAGLRHRPNVDRFDFLKQWLRVGRMFGYATHDDSWGEFEKEFAIIITRVVRAEAICKSLLALDEYGKTHSASECIAKWKELIERTRE